ncbi:MAG: aspartate/glutamate racemase family protein [Rhizobiales bacterium]|nr:aspartate/glutamate racemase family protein [Hyphomicrobiales bacterium]
MRILLINPNTTPAITALVSQALRDFLPPESEVIEATGRFGSAYITSRASYAIGGHAALDALACHANIPLDAVMLACFGDPALSALREISAVPVIGMAEAACLLATKSDGPFSIVTGGTAWVPLLREFVSAIGLSDRLASVRASAMTGGEIARDPDGALSLLSTEIDACQADGARQVILGGAGLAGLSKRLASRSALPIVDCVEAMARMTMEAIHHDRQAGHSSRTSPQASFFRANLQ